MTGERCFGLMFFLLPLCFVETIEHFIIYLIFVTPIFICVLINEIEYQIKQKKKRMKNES